MKRIYKRLIIIIIVLLSILFVYSYFHIKGNEIYGVSNISPESSVIITKSYIYSEDEEEDENRHKYVLNAKQIESLKSLILKSKFTRTLYSSVRVNDRDTYVIEIDFNNSEYLLRIFVVGNEYISIPSQFKGKYFKINNPNWKSTLENIILP